MSELQLKKSNYIEFNDELLSIIEEERLNAEAPKVPHIIPLEQT
jgi:hypothetical protein